MKLFPVLFLIAIIAISPVIFEDVFAEHVPRASGGNYDDAFYYQEVDDATGNCVVNDYVGNVGIQITAVSTQYCMLFKVFDTADLDGESITVDGSWYRQSSTQSYTYMKIWDGEYIAGNSTDFQTDTDPFTKGAGQIYTSGGTTPTPTNPTGALDLSSATLDKVTVGFGFLEALTGTSSFTMRSLHISNLGDWYFCGAGATNCDTYTPFRDYGTGQLEWGEVYSVDLSAWISGASPTDLGVTVTNNTSVLFDWTEVDDAGTGIQNIYQGLNTTSYMIEYKNGTASESDYWTLITNGYSDVGDVELYQTGNIFEAGHGYTARVIALGGEGNNTLAEPSNEITFTMTGSSASTQTYDTALDRQSDGIDNRFYYREYQGANYFSGSPLSALCGVHNYYVTPSSGYQIGTTNAGTGNCAGFIKVLPSADVMDVEWTMTASYHRSADQTYHQMIIVDGDWGDVYNSTQWPHNNNVLELHSQFSTELYDNGVTAPSPALTFTPTGATEDYVTVFIAFTDQTGNDVFATWQKLSIAGYETFYFANTADLQTEFPDNNYIDGTEHDWGFVNAIYVPTPTGLTTTLSEDEQDVSLSWTVASGDYMVTPTGYSIQRECPSGGGWKEIVADTGDTLLTYTDVDPFTGVSGIYEETFTDDVYQPDWQSTDDQEPHFMTYHSGSDALLFAPELDATDVHIVYPLPGGAISDSLWTMEYKLTMTDTTSGGTVVNYMWFGLSDLNSGSVQSVAQDFIGISFFGWTNLVSNIYISYRDGAGGATNTDTGYDLPRTEGEDYYFKITRTSTTNVNLKIYSTPYEDLESLLFEKNQVIPSSVIGLDNIIMSNYIASSASEIKFAGNVDNLKIGDGVDNLQSASISCTYRIASVSSLGNSANSNEASVSQTTGVSLTSPANLVCNPTGTDRVELQWTYGGAEPAEGFRIDGTTPVGGTYSQYVSDTGNANLVRTITGLNENQYYQFKTAVLVSPDTSGFSNEASCKTNASGGGGSSSPGTPSTPVVDPVTGEVSVPGDAFVTQTPSTPISGEQSALFDLTFPLIQELSNTFNDDIFTLVGAKHSAGLGQTIEGEILVGWNNENNILINSIIIAPTQLSVIPNPLPPYIAEGGQTLSDNEIKKLSIVPPTSPNIKSHQLIPYSITIPSVFCGAGITEQCVEPGTHKIPIKVISTQSGANIANTARIEVAVGVPTIQFDIPTFVLLALITVAIIGGIQVARKIKASKKGVKHL